MLRKHSAHNSGPGPSPPSLHLGLPAPQNLVPLQNPQAGSLP